MNFSKNGAPVFLALSWYNVGIALTKKGEPMEMPKVSICCITYNHEKYIRKALESFLMQKCDFSFEILIHDDASTDNCRVKGEINCCHKSKELVVFF